MKAARTPSRFAAGLFAAVGACVGGLMLLVEPGWDKVAAVPVLGMSLLAAKYALQHRTAPQSAAPSPMLSRILLTVLLVALVLIVIDSSLWRRIIVAAIVIAFFCAVVIVRLLRYQLVRNLAQCNREDRERILTRLEPVERARVLELLERTTKGKGG
jgi:predicted lysophospholipase L1 biosynthesis ABC-type transport system permease subunit